MVMFNQPGPAQVTHSNYLALDLHWDSVIKILGEVAHRQLDPNNFRVICVDLCFTANGDVNGNGPMTLHIARINQNHFIPLERVWHNCH